jgi:signal transduction histidine kinase
MNLCTNSSHAISNNGGVLEVSIQCLNLTNKECAVLPLLSSGPHISLEVTDTGCGMTEELINRIFEPYFTTKHKSQGTGLGLYTSKSIIEESLKGNLSVINGKNGAIFKIELPLK